ncbi:MAG: IclR family transcriptional regulator [Anaerolineae bacterium]|nr:IclR family transcriptional regulator [Anaerolineae bacterium]
MSEKEERYLVRALDRGVRILSMLSDGKPRTLMELSEALPLSSSTTYRLLATLSHHNYVQRDEQSGKYALGFACLELAHSYQVNHYVRKVAQPILEWLRDESGETIHLAVLDNMEVAYLEKLQGLHAIGIMSSQVGGKALSYCTGLGKVLLAYANPDRVKTHFARFKFRRFTDTTIDNLDDLMFHLADVRRRGYAFDQGEHEPEVRCVAAPIFNANNEVVAAISLSGPANRLEPLAGQTEHIAHILNAARTISTQLGYHPSDNSS